MASPAPFKRMDESTQEQWMHILHETQADQARVPRGIMRMLKSLDLIFGGFGVSQLHHALQTATMAKRDNASDELVLAALCHDLGKAISIPGHGPISAAILKPYVSEDTFHIVRTHQDFQGQHYYGYFDMPTDLRRQYENEPWFAAAVRFTDDWDQKAFDPAYDVLPLDGFEPLVDEYFGKFVL